MRGYLDVAYRLGRLLSGLREGGMRQCRLLYRGEIADRDTKVLSAAFAAGLLDQVLDDDVNIVNAEWLLRERGVEVSEELRHDMGAFRSAMSAAVVSDSGSCEATATLFGERMPRLVNLDGYRLEAFMDGCLLVFRHSDVPGIIGTVGTIFGSHDINIAQMAVGRAGDAPGGEAIGVLNLDSAPCQEGAQGGSRASGDCLRTSGSSARGRAIARVARISG